MTLNVKAERIERFLQIVNRGLLLVTSGQRHDASALEFRKLQKVDAGIFGSDKFAFEMVHFLKSAAKGSKTPADSMAFHWEQTFLQGLETLLVECAVVVDDVERECFVSRVYGWFTEKLAERRDFPRGPSQNEALGDLRTSIAVMNAKHTLAGIEQQQNSPGPPGTASRGGDKMHLDGTHPDGLPADPFDYDIPPISLPTYQSFSTRHNKLPVYVRHHLPNVFREGSEYVALLPKIPDADATGPMGHPPVSDVEKSMHELWLARRRQEAFDWKTQQHMALVMDRMELHRSRLESDALRRQESNTYLNRKPGMRPYSAGDVGSRFAPHLRSNSPKRPHGDYPNSESLQALFQRPDSPDPSEAPAAVPPAVVDPEAPLEEEAEEEEEAPEDIPEVTVEPEASVTTVVAKLPGREEETSVPKLSRTTVQKSKSQRFLPMRYKLEPLESFNRNYERQELYMQLSDSDDDEDKDRLPRLQGTGIRAGTGTGGGAKGKPAAKGAKGPAVLVKFKRDKPLVRDRPVSSRQFREVATNDTELKVHYRHSNFRRMPLTEVHQEWLQGRESEREKKSLDVAAQLVEAAAAKDEKGKGKDKEGGKKEDKGDKGKDAKGKKGPAVVETPVKVKPKYSSASQFMGVHFPNFDAADEQSDSHGPMRSLQLIECARIMGAMEEFGQAGSVSEKALRKALVVPQDRPEAISLENLRENETEGLWKNPIPFEFWRKVVIATAKKKKGGKKGK